MKSFLLGAGLAAVAVVSSPAFGKGPALQFRPVTGAFFALSVPDMAASVSWYTDKLGLHVVNTVPGSPEVAVLEGGGLIVELIRDPAAQPGPAQPELQHGVFK